MGHDNPYAPVGGLGGDDDPFQRLHVRAAMLAVRRGDVGGCRHPLEEGARRVPPTAVTLDLEQIGAAPMATTYGADDDISPAGAWDLPELPCRGVTPLSGAASRYTLCRASDHRNPVLRYGRRHDRPYQHPSGPRSLRTRAH